MHKKSGFALIQALFFMMFIMAAISIGMMMSFQRNMNIAGERLANDAYPVLNSLLTYTASQPTADAVTTATTYFTAYPISSDYCAQLVRDHFIASSTQCTDGTWSSNITMTRSSV